MSQETLIVEELPAEWGAEPTPSLNPAHIFASVICGCGRGKRHGSPLCSVCWEKSPIDLRKDAWQRKQPEQQIAALMELRRILEHTHEPVKPGHINALRSMAYPVAEEQMTPAPEPPQPEPIEPQSPPARAPRYIVRLTENQMDKFLVSASAEWKQSMVQALLDAEDE